MNLTIDIGNSTIKTIVFNDTIPMYRNISESLASINLSRIVTRFKIRHSIYSSVVSLNKAELKQLKNLPNGEMLSHTTIIPIKNRYKTPETLGNDRLANVIAASFLFPKKNVLVIDMGTCIKYDFLNSRNEYLGGGISPGLEMRFRALHEFTGKLPLITDYEKVNLIGSSTREAMKSGVMEGITQELNGNIKSYKKRFPSIKVILTGGDAQRFVSELNLSIFAAENLVNIGLNEIIRFHQRSTF